MSIQYIKNKRLWDKQQKKISKVMEKPYESLSIYDKLEIAYDKYLKLEKISYAEYELMALFAGDEIWFYYKDAVYQIDYGLPNITAMYITKYKNKQKVSERSENFSTVSELLNKFKIDGKTIKEIWDDVTFCE